MNKEDFTRAVKLFEEHKHIIKLLDEINSRNYYNSTIKIINRVCDITIDDDAINKKAIEYIIQSYKDRLNCINNQLLALEVDIFEE